MSSSQLTKHPDRVRSFGGYNIKIVDIPFGCGPLISQGGWVGLRVAGMTKIVECILSADIGAANARFANAKNGTLGPITTVDVAKFPTLRAALRALYQDGTLEQAADRAMIAVAGPVKNGRAALTNAEEVCGEFGPKMHLVSDFAAVAHAIPSLAGPEDL